MYLLEMYKSFPIDIDRAKGIHIYSKSGKDYIDTFTGIGVTAMGHSCEPLVKKLKEKMDRFMHLSNFYVDEDGKRVAEKLVKFTGIDGKVFFTNSGTEAIEGALKAVKKKIKNKKIVNFTNSFHGRTLGALSINGIRKIRDQFLPLLPNTVELPFNNVPSFEEYMEKHGEDTGAVFFEPVQGAGGVLPVDESFVEAIKSYREKFNYLIVIDEIQAGMGRTGKIYAHQNFNIEPDIIAVGKALGGGLPLGAAVFLKESGGILKQGEHGTTFAPNPVALTGARFILETLPGLIEEVSKKGLYLENKLKELKNPKISGLRGMGLMMGVILDKSYNELKDVAFEKENLLLNFVCNNAVIRLLPPLNIEYKEIDLIVEKIDRALKETEK